MTPRLVPSGGGAAEAGWALAGLVQCLHGYGDDHEHHPTHHPGDVRRVTPVTRQRGPTARGILTGVRAFVLLLHFDFNFFFFLGKRVSEERGV